MTLSSKLRAEYVELINQALDTIPMLKSADFRTAVVNLKKIISSASGAIDFDPEFKESMDMVYEYLHQPELYIAARADDAEYQQIIKDRIQAKINEFNSFSPAQKYQYVMNQKEMRDRVAKNQKIMASGEQKRQEAEKDLADRRGRFRQQQAMIEAQIRGEGENINRLQSPAFFRHTTEYDPLLDRFVSRGLLSVERARELTWEQISRLTGLVEQGAGNFQRLILDNRLSAARAMQLTYEQQLLLTSGKIAELVQNGVLPSENALQLTDEQRATLTFGQIFDLIMSGHLSFEHALQLREGERAILGVGRPYATDAGRLVTLHSNLYWLIHENFLSVDDALRLSENQRAVLTTGVIFDLVRKNRLSPALALQLTEEQRITLTGTLAQLVLDDKISAERALELTKEQRDILGSSSRFYLLISGGRLSAENALQLNDADRTKLVNDPTYTLIMLKRLSIDRALELTQSENELLAEPTIFEKIKHNKMTVDEALSQLSGRPGMR